MPLDQYVTLGRSGLRVSPLCLGAMTFGEDLGWGTSVEESQQIIDRYTRTRRQLHRHRQLLHPEPLREDPRRPHRPPRRPTRPSGDRDQVQRQPVSGRSQRWRLGPQIVDQRLRKLAAAVADRLHRPVLAAHLGRQHPDRGNDGRTRRPRCGRQGSLHRCFGHPGVEDRGSQPDCPFPRLVQLSSACRSSTRCSNAPSSRNWCRWRANSASASRPGRR